MKRIILLSSIAAALLLTGCYKTATCNLIINNKTNRYVEVSGEVKQNVTIQPYGIGSIKGIKLKDDFDHDRIHFYIGGEECVIKFRECDANSNITVNYTD